MKGKWGVPLLIALLIALGLALRYGQSSNYILADFFNGTNGWFKTLSLQNLPAGKGAVYGNNPTGGNLIG